jgi:hypothetical protein
LSLVKIAGRIAFFYDPRLPRRLPSVKLRSSFQHWEAGEESGGYITSFDAFDGQEYMLINPSALTLSIPDSAAGH